MQASPNCRECLVPQHSASDMTGDTARVEIAAAIDNLSENVARLTRRLQVLFSPEKNLQTALTDIPSGEMSLQPTEVIEKATDPIIETSGRTEFPAAFPEPTDTPVRAESLIASGVADLYDRLGGFINADKPVNESFPSAQR